MDGAVLKELRNEHKSSEKGLGKARDTMRNELMLLKYMIIPITNFCKKGGRGLFYYKHV